MQAAGFDEDDVDRVVWRNPVEFFGQSGRLILDDLGEQDLRRRSRATRSCAGALSRAAAPSRRQPLHLAYCSNVHPADDLDGVAAQLERFSARVRERLGVPVLGVGLWVAAPPRSPTTRRAADRLRGELTRARARGRDAERLPVPRPSTRRS